MHLPPERREATDFRFHFSWPLNFFTEHELLAAEKWRNVYLAYLRSITDDSVPDDRCEEIREKYMIGVSILEAQDLSKPYCKRKRVLHAVNAVCVYGEPEELGERDYTLAAAKIGFSDLAANNF